MSELGKHHLTDAVTQAQQGGDAPTSHQQPQETHENLAEQQREAQEGQDAHNAQGGLRDRLVDIGKANHMGGRSQGRVSDQG